MKDFLTVGDKGLFESLLLWGLLGLIITAIILAIIASTTGGRQQSEFNGFEFEGFPGLQQ